MPSIFVLVSLDSMECEENFISLGLFVSLEYVQLFRLLKFVNFPKKKNKEHDLLN